ncbi:DUF1993 family protein [Altererythrobacter indicus]|uniref:DUF1993 family protein n=1 Tax=Altericroceibacterium indicum TaxID=374177 RepID=A0A845A7N7_9SPHN|nr:DUF1993 domain-containing protein [Altericroceibacterium indicum]MXP25537.1 DUF1993 family protein [Altericroceibacterium indicum]
MPLSLHTALVPTWLQILGSCNNLIDKAEAFDCDDKELLSTCLAEDMLPLAYQLKSCAVHSLGAIEGVRKGVFSPDMNEPPANFSDMRNLLNNAITKLEQVEESELESYIGQPMRFEMGEFKLHFLAENFLLSFSQPNFFFHATTAYDILRMKGVPVGKRDFLGAVQIVTS